MNEEFQPEAEFDPVASQWESRLTAMILGEASDFEIDQLMQLIESNPAVAKLYRQLLAVHQMMGEVSAGEFPYGTGAANDSETSGVSDASSAAGHGNLDQDWKFSDARRRQLDAVLAGKTDEVVFHAISDSSSAENGIVDRMIKSEDQKLHRRRLGGLPLKIVLGGSTVAALVVVGAVLFVPSSALLETGWVATDSAAGPWKSAGELSERSPMASPVMPQMMVLSDDGSAGAYFEGSSAVDSPAVAESMPGAELGLPAISGSSNRSGSSSHDGVGGDSGVSAKAALLNLSQATSLYDQPISGSSMSSAAESPSNIPSFGREVDSRFYSRGGEIAQAPVVESRSAIGQTSQFFDQTANASTAAMDLKRQVADLDALADKSVDRMTQSSASGNVQNFEFDMRLGGKSMGRDGVSDSESARGLAAGRPAPSGPGGFGGGGGLGGGGGSRGGLGGSGAGGLAVNGDAIVSNEFQEILERRSMRKADSAVGMDRLETKLAESKPDVSSDYFGIESESLASGGRPGSSSASPEPQLDLAFSQQAGQAGQLLAMKQESGQMEDSQQQNGQLEAAQQIARDFISPPGMPAESQPSAAPFNDLLNRRTLSNELSKSRGRAGGRSGRGGQASIDEALVIRNELSESSQEMSVSELKAVFKDVEPKSWFEGDVPKTETAVASLGKQSEAEPQSHIESTFQAGAIRSQKLLDQTYALDSVEETGVPFDDRRSIAYPAESSNDAAGKKLADSTTTVDVPDGGTILLGGVKRQASDSSPEMADQQRVFNRSTNAKGETYSILDLEANERLVRSAQLFGDRGTGSPRVVVRSESATEEYKVKESGTDESGAKASLAEISRLNSMWGASNGVAGNGTFYYRQQETIVDKEVDLDGDGISEATDDTPIQLSVTDTESRFDSLGELAGENGRLMNESWKGKATNRLSAPAELNEESAADNAFSTFSLHVSDVSFKLANSALAQGQWPDPEKIRIEEFVNAIDYRDPLPAIEDKVACQVEQAIHPFYQQRNVLRVSMRTAATGRSSSVPLRLTLLLDNSGSMDRSDRSQTVQRAVDSLAKQLGPADQITLISFANKPRLLADQLNGVNAGQLLPMIAGLPSEGGTNFETALQLATEKAMEQHQGNAQNRIVLLTDGAVNLGDADPDRLSKLVTQMRDNRIAFDAAGISAQDLNDEVLESLTRQGDGRYYLLDSEESVEDGFAEQLAGALRPSAKNVKIQVEFNPQRVGNYKLLGFEKHRLNKEDFRNDAVDAAELSAEEAGVAVYQFEAMPEGSGDVGAVSVRFQDLNTGQMVERRWPIPYDPSAPRVEESSTSMKLATASAMLAAKLKGDALGSNVELKALGQLIADLPDAERNERRVVELNNMIQQSRQISEGR